jgi:bacteriocin leader peptide (microcyclamide/patellamide family)
MDKQNLMPLAAQPVNRITTGQLPTELAELSEEALQLHGESSASVAPSLICMPFGMKVVEGLCSYDGDDA